MLKSFFWNRETALYSWLMLAWLLFVGWYSVEILVYYNAWNREFYDAIQTLQEETFWELLWGWDTGRFFDFLMLRIDSEMIVPSFLEIIVLYTPIAVYSTWQTQRYTFAWREANTMYYLKRWEKSTAKIEGGSQRIQEDLMVFGKTLQGLFAGFVNKIFVLAAFLPVLWNLSEGLPVWGDQIIPGFLVWVALTMSLGGTLLSFLLGIKLPGLEYNNQVVEAQFRKKLVHSEDDFNHRLTADLFPMFASIKRNYYRLFNWYMGFGVWQTAFGMIAGNVALVVLAPSYFAQLVTFGVLIQVLNAFGRVESALTYFIDRWTTIVDFQSVIKRLREFNRVLDEADANSANATPPSNPTP
jgi:peptide/bleomycin uptake transporter